MFVNVPEMFAEELEQVSFDGTTFTYGSNSTKHSQTLAKWIVQDNEITSGDFYREEQFEKLLTIVLDYLLETYANSRV